ATVLPAAAALGLPVSIDTMKSKVAAWALGSGAAIVNDVWGLQRDPDLARVVAEHSAPVIIMHNRAAADPSIDIMADIVAFFSRPPRLRRARGKRARERRARPRDRFRQAAGANPRPHRAARRAQVVPPAAARRRLAQALHRQGIARPARPTAGRIDRRPS